MTGGGGGGGGLSLDANVLKRMLKPMPSAESPVTSPEMTRRRYNYYNNHHHHHHHHHHGANNNGRHVLSEPEFSGSRSSHEIGRGGGGFGPRGLYLELEREGGGGGGGDLSPPSATLLFDQPSATPPRRSSSNGNSDRDQPRRPYAHYARPPHPHPHSLARGRAAPARPPRLPHLSACCSSTRCNLRNTLGQGHDAESYSLSHLRGPAHAEPWRTWFAESLPGSTQRSPYPTRRRPGSSASMNKSSTLPLPHRGQADRPASSAARDREGYYSDRNELLRERERERERERGYLSDHNSRCASCLGESARAQWFRHSDGWRSGSSTFGSGSGAALLPGGGGGGSGGGGGHKRSPWDSLPSLRHEGSLGDSGYKSNRADSFEQR
ncbi:uncharacterized protein GBIM_02359 [Gryllus bimaculatus]|nr:uncharacterized protein GBIM_02359 [Gryllus bimaculatus]